MVNTFCRLADYFSSNDPDSCDYYVNHAISLSKKINYPRGIFQAQVAEFFKVNFTADYPKALEIAQNNLMVAEKLPYDKLSNMAYAHNVLGTLALLMGDNVRARNENQEAVRLQKASGKLDADLWSVLLSRSRLPDLSRNRDSGLAVAHRAVDLAKAAPFRRIYSCFASALLADLYQNFGMYPEARHYYQQGLGQAQYFDNSYIEARIYMNLMQLSIRTNEKDSAIYFAQRALQVCKLHRFRDYASTVADSLSKIYEREGRIDSALTYMKVMVAAKDSIFSQSKMQAFQRLISENDQRQREAEAATERLENRIKLYASLSGIAIFLILSGILFRNNRQKQKAYTIIRKQKQETDYQKAKVEEAYHELKSTQQQLIQSEKMASLGELTAGIAHEIQNPLNFVNNFSEVNTELFEEMEKEFKSGNSNDAFAIAGDIKQNLEKINQHGKRADAIVKGMLLHSRMDTGKIELTDINSLAREYLRLSFHGMKAREGSFQCEINEDLDPSIGKINILPQDMGRVFLNIFNNAFYYLNEKKKKLGEGFDPKLTISSRKAEHTIVIRIMDNGLGISQKNIDKIFQPFFTTKPTGLGTGLGLSLAYDIVTKEHGGTMAIDSKDGEYAEFVITIPSHE